MTESNIKLEQLGENKQLRMNSKGEVYEVQVPIIRVMGKNEDDTALIKRVCARINWQNHNPTIDHPRQGRKRGKGKNRATKRGTGKGGKR